MKKFFVLIFSASILFFINNVKANFEKNSFDVELRYQIVGLPPVETIEFVLQRPE